MPPFLNTDLLTVSQSSGKLPECKVKIGAISSLQYVSIQVGILSGPHDLDESRVDSKFFNTVYWDG